MDIADAVVRRLVGVNSIHTMSRNRMATRQFFFETLLASAVIIEGVLRFLYYYHVEKMKSNVQAATKCVLIVLE